MLSERERSRLRFWWRNLANEALKLSVDGIGSWPDHPNWQSPFESRAISGALFALSRLSTAYTRGTLQDRQHLAAALKATAMCALFMMGEEPLPAPPARVPATPARRRVDIDGPAEDDEA